MKYLKYIIFTFLLMLPLNADATIRMSCGGPAKINQKITCDITTDAPIISFKSNLVVDPAVIFGGATGSTNFESLCSHTYLEFRSLNSADKGLIGYYEITVPDTTKTSFTLTLTNVEYANESDTKTQPNITEIVQISTTTKKTTTTTQKTTTQSGSDKTFSVILNSNNGTNKTETKTCKTTGSNCKINLSEISAPVKTNFVFNGWGNFQTCTEGSKTSYTATENVTLYACWQANSTETPDEGEKLYLQTLTIEGQQIEFSKFKQEYDIVVLYQVENLIINATPVKEGVKVDLNESYPLEIGENKILINLSDNDNSTTYTINVKRLKEGEEIRTPSNDATLKNIMIEGYDVNFTSGTFDYILKVSSGTTSLDVTAELNDEYGEYVITGNNDIKEGSVIKITVKAEDGTLNTYNITIEIAKGIKDYLIYIIIGSILLISIIVLVIVNQSKNQKKQDTKKTIKTKAPSKKTQTKGKSAVAPIVKSIPQAVTPQPVVPQPVVPQPVTPQPVTPQPVTPQPVVPQPVTPQPVVPKPPEPKDSVEVLDL